MVDVRRNRRSLGVSVGVSVGLSVFIAGSSASAGTPWIDAPVDEGSVRVVDVDDPTREFAAGASATVFTLALPEGATCPGDSANDQWRVNSFIIPADRDPGDLEYLVGDPEGEGNWSLYGVDTNPMIFEFTIPNVAAGLPGIIPEIRPMSFGVFPPGTLPAGRYRMGIACAYFADTGTYWDTEIVIATDADDEPGQITWSIPEASADAVDANSQSPGTRTWAWISAGVFAALASGLVLVQRRWRKPVNLSKEPS